MSDDLSLNGTIEVSPDLEARARQLGASYTVNPLLVPGTWRVVTMSTPESKPSPGPWFWRPEAHSTNCLAASDGLTVAIYDRSNYPGENPHEPADKALLAAAPEMAAMLRSLEWAGGAPGPLECPECGRVKLVNDGKGGTVINKHDSDCRLSSLLDRVGRAEKTEKL